MNELDVFRYGRQTPTEARNLSMRNTIPLLAISLLVPACGSDININVRTNQDEWFQARNNLVDILWVVDDSCSMEEEQDTLAEGFSTFVGEMEASGTEFHIGVISTSFDSSDSDRGELLGEPTYLTNEDDYIGLFEERALLGVEGSDKEKGFQAADWALSTSMSIGHNEGFLREEAQLLIVFVSDEEDCSDEGALDHLAAEHCYKKITQLVPVFEYVESFRTLKEDDADVQISAIVGRANNPCDDAFPGARYSQAAKMTGGTVGDICKSNWSDLMDDLGLVASGVRNTFQLSRGAHPDSLKVTVDGEKIKHGWTYDPDTWYITFGPNAIPPRDSAIVAEYEIQPGSSTPPAESTL